MGPQHLSLLVELHVIHIGVDNDYRTRTHCYKYLEGDTITCPGDLCEIQDTSTDTWSDIGVNLGKRHHAPYCPFHTAQYSLSFGVTELTL